MNCWEQLGIQPTGDLDEIKKAFAAQSKRCHPEEDPEGFKQLRDTYRQALNIAKYRREVASSTFDFPAAESDNPITPPVAEGPEKRAEALDFSNIKTPAASVDETADMDSYNFGSVERIEVPEESYYSSAFASQPTGLPPYVESQRQFQRKLNYFRRLRYEAPVRGRLFSRLGIFISVVMCIIMVSRNLLHTDQPSMPLNATSIITPAQEITDEIIDALRKQASDLWNTHSLDRDDIMNAIRQNKTFEQCPLAEKLGLTERAYDGMLANYKRFDEKTIRNELEVYTGDEQVFITEEILPVIKKAFMQGSVTSIIAYELGTVVGMSIEAFQEINDAYGADHDEAALDRRLIIYNRLVSPDRWVFFGDTLKNED